MLRVLLIAGSVACGVVVVALGFVRHYSALMAPVNLVLFAAGVLLYLLPMELAMYRDCRSAAWIALVNVFLGWTIIGWFAALGWAAACKVREAAHPIGAPSAHPAAGH
jgi:hypothetical protein